MVRNRPQLMTRLRIIVGGFLGLLPAGGVTWDYVQYPVGLAALGHDVYYVEDTRLWPIYQTGDHSVSDCSANVAHLAAVMDAFGLGDRWAYRDEVSGQCFGLAEAVVRELCCTADILLNISCATFLRDEYSAIPIRALVDSDPMFTQIQYASQTAFTKGSPGMRELVEGHTHHFTFGENVGTLDCRIPTCGVTWQPTRQPICLPYWSATCLPKSSEAAYTTLMNWTAAPPLLYDGETWGQKDVEFRHFFTLPQAVPGIHLAVAVAQTTGIPFPRDEALRLGWYVLNPAVCAPDWQTYQTFIQKSRGEFSVAKETYVKARTGWFSCRSTCYLASARPVVTQDTGWSSYLPTGEGLFAFNNQQEAIEALLDVAADPNKHARAARAIAEEYFASDRVLSKMLTQMGA